MSTTAIVTIFLVMLIIAVICLSIFVFESLVYFKWDCERRINMTEENEETEETEETKK